MSKQIDYFMETDVLVIGCGIAGGVTALQLADAGHEVTVITRTQNPRESNTYYAQGGIIYQGVNDSPALLAEDVIRAGAGRSVPHSVHILARQGPELVREVLLERVGVPFDRNGGGALSLGLEGGHSLPRIIHSADATGKAIETTLIEKLQGHPRVKLLNGYTAIDLLVSRQANGGRACAGAYLLEQSGERVVTCLARDTVLATGGLGQIFLRTTNPAGARGDGVAMAYRAGASVADMEFVQFHPTAFYQPEAPPFLISEAVRGAGARLVNGNGQPFMQKYDPEWRDLAPRDVVARCIHQEMMVTGAPNVYLDLRSYIPADQIVGRFPNIYAQCLAYGVDITRELAPVVPAAHYACGGVWVDDWGRTTVDQLYAVGEVARTGLHGANRLASTSLLEGLVWGYRAAQNIQDRLGGQRRPNPAGFRPAGCTGPAAAKADIERMMAAIRRIMWYNVGLERTTHSLEEAREKLGSLGAEIERLYQTHPPSDALVGLRNAGQAARLVTQAALDNREGVGCHYRIEECVPN